MRETIYPKDAKAQSPAPGTALDAVRQNKRPDLLSDDAVFATLNILEQTLKAVAQRGFFAASSTMASGLRGLHKLHSHKRRAVADTLHQIVRQLRRLRALCEKKAPGAQPLLLAHLLDTDQAHLVSAATFSSLVKRSHLDPSTVLLRRTQLDGRLANLHLLTQAEQAAVLGEALSYPDWLAEAFVAEFGPLSARQILSAQNGRAPLTLRVHLGRSTPQQLIEQFAALRLAAQTTQFSPWGVLLSTHINVYQLPGFAEGLFEVQDEGSQLITELCSPPKEAVVVDFCAGAGGKTLGLSAMLKNRGRVLALDVDEHKLQELKKRARRAGQTNIETHCITDGALPPRLLSQLGRGVSRVLVDAPCSGLGVLRRNPEARWRLAPSSVDELAVKQRRILARAAELVAPQGLLVYATCTLLRKENDAVVDEFLAQRPSWVSVPVKDLLGAARARLLGDGERLRILPTPDGPDGFFAAALLRTGQPGH